MPTVWFCKISREQFGPLSSQQLLAMVAAGRLTPEDHVRRGAEGSWLPAARVEGLFPREKSMSGGPPAPRPGVPREVTPPAPPPARNAPLPAATPQVPQAQSLPKVASAVPVAPRSPTGGAANVGQSGITTEQSAAAVRAAGGSAAVTASRNKRRYDALVVGTLAVLAVGLAVAGVVLVLANRDLTEPASEAPAPSSAKPPPEEIRLSGKPADGNWLDASEDAIRVGHARVKISSAKVGGPGLIQEALQLPGRPTRDLMLIAVELENAGADRNLKYVGWGGGSPIGHQVTLTDSLGKIHRPIRFRGVPTDGQVKSAVIGPNERIQDLLVFDPPAEGAEFLLLRLPAATLGQPGELCFKIPREMIGVADRQPEPSDPARPLETGVPEINRGIAELQAEGRQPGRPDDAPGDGAPDVFKDYPELRGDDKGADDGPGLEGKSDNFQPSPPNRRPRDR